MVSVGIHWLIVIVWSIRVNAPICSSLTINSLQAKIRIILFYCYKQQENGDNRLKWDFCPCKHLLFFVGFGKQNEVLLPGFNISPNVTIAVHWTCLAHLTEIAAGSIIRDWCIWPSFVPHTKCSRSLFEANKGQIHSSGLKHLAHFECTGCFIPFCGSLPLCHTVGTR